MFKRSFILLVAGLGVLGLLVGPVSAAERSKSLAFAGTESDPAGPQPDGVSCSTVDGGCRAVAVGHAIYAGGLTGTATYVLRPNIVPQRDGLHYTGSEHFARLKTPCGTGAVDVDLYGTYASKFDPVSHTTTTIEHATFRGGSGTGELSKMVGGWTAILREHNDGTNDDRYSGSMACSTRR